MLLKLDYESLRNVSQYACVTGTLPNATNTWGKYDYPDGFTQDNCFIISKMAKINSDWVESTYGTGVAIGVSLSTDKVRVDTQSDPFKGQAFRILLCKYN